MATSVWNSLEVVKLVVASVTPVTVALVGYWISRSVKQIEGHQWSERKAIEWRIDVFEKVSSPLNDIYCYFLYVGDWKAITPMEAIAMKRRVDKIMNAYALLFSATVWEAYRAFMDACFDTYRGKGVDAGLRTGFASRRTAFGDAWDSKWEHLFVQFDSIHSSEQNRAVIARCYKMLLLAISADLTIPGVCHEWHLLSSKENWSDAPSPFSSTPCLLSNSDGSKAGDLEEGIQRERHESHECLSRKNDS